MRCVVKQFLVFLAIATGSSTAFAQATLKIATLAPQGSAWMNLFDEAARNIARQTGGRVKIKYFPGGIAGDERDTIRKVRAGQLQGTAVTSIGLMQMVKEVRVLELPGMFHTDAELDYVRGRLAPEFAKKFEDAGYVLLSWGDVGWIHLFSNTPIAAKSDLSKVKMWVWTDDPVYKKLFERLGINGVALGLPEVLPSLQTGMINGAYGSSLSTLALQWYTKVKYMTEKSTSYSIGAAVLSKKAFDAIGAPDRAIIREEAKLLQGKLIAQIRKDNQAAANALAKQGLKTVRTSDAFSKQIVDASQLVWSDMVGVLYSKDLLDRVLTLVSEFRAGKK